MEELRKCKWCGSLFRPTRATHECCSKNCSANAYYHEQIAAEKPIPKELICPYNVAVICKSHGCDTCGWNPKVAQERLDKIVAKMKEARA